MDETKATYTPNIRLEKPGKKQRYDVGVFNANYDKIDKAIGDNKLLANGKENIGVAKKLADKLEASKENKGVAKNLDDALKTEILNSVLSVKDFPLNNAENGWAKLPNGLIIQWGKGGKVKAQTWEKIRFPIAFPNKCLNFSVSTFAHSENNTQYQCESYFQITGITQTEGTVFLQWIGQQGYNEYYIPYIFAIGY